MHSSMVTSSGSRSADPSRPKLTLLLLLGNQSEVANLLGGQGLQGAAGSWLRAQKNREELVNIQGTE